MSGIRRRARRSPDLEGGGPPGHRGARAPPPGRGAGRGLRAGGGRRRARGVATDRSPRPARRLADDHGQEPGAERAPADRDGRANGRGSGARGLEAAVAHGARGGAGGDRGPGRARRRASAALHRLPSGAVAGGPGDADPPGRGRAVDRGDRPRIPHHRTHHCPARGTGQAGARRGAAAVRGAARSGAAGAAAVGARGAVPGVQRGPHRDGGRGADPARSHERGAPAGGSPGRAASRRARGPRPPRPDAVQRLTRTQPDRRPRRPESSSRRRTARAGTPD